MMKMIVALAAMMMVGLAACDRGLSRQELRDRAEELQADMLAGAGGEVVRELRELAARSPDRALRDSATALVTEVDALFDELIRAQREILELTAPASEDRGNALSWVVSYDPVKAAEAAVERTEGRRDGTWQEIRTQLEGETIEAVDEGMIRGAKEKTQLTRNLEAAKRRLAAAQTESQEAPTPAPAQSAAPVESASPSKPPTRDSQPAEETAERVAGTASPEATPAPAPPPAKPDPEAVRDSASAEIEELESLYDDLIEILEAIHEAQTDGELRRRAEQAVTLAGMDKRRGIESFRNDVAAEPMWRVTGARRGVSKTKARVEREIKEARETLAKLRGG